MTYIFIIILLVIWILINIPFRVNKNKIENFNIPLSNPQNTTYIIGFWEVKNNKKNSINHYYNLLPKTLSLIPQTNLIFFYDDESILKLVKNNVLTDNVIYIKRKITELPTYNLSEKYLQTCQKQDNKKLKKINTHQEKGLIHYHREYQKGGSQVFRDTFSIWTSKIYLIQEIIKKNPWNSEYFSWLDSSTYRMKKNPKIFTRNYDSKYIYHLTNPMKYYGDKIKVAGVYLLGHRNMWNLLIPKYIQKLKENQNSKYCHDEETILKLIWQENSNLFFNINKIKI